MISQFLLYFSPAWAPLVMRVVIGGLLMAHGQQKTGAGFAPFADWLASLGFRPGRFWAAVVLVTELLGGVFLVAGLLTHFTALVIAFQFAVILVWVKPFWRAPLTGNGGWELDLLFFAGALTLLFTGAGAYALDAALFLIFF
ncbi:MAG: hypothetical protein A3I44_04885 [Candidatus Sungbacteria bacterium RIFCSPLOWO2_02_FULL_51_17]|uniref:DoxX family protein n=1 Tax=Candidatus Sungbacteria bacterium RIFCSPHIGHO2_02_FULL_51_29 TaxID=1802273 RepID=A0A1G2KW70_9BACT|nr:MAG: hypothetical protein A2676_00095 [Candidatus Sungbacteria bacterium RIFCSPHIGHO2_01_FULL_51_22]OHA02711.1 MAG: hypothetical protein A3C16_00285 [Candidatus Sungbacteria bacterium RIFCSPHIGHO2_02_FULL_51_29]OHA06875.1 MAG: hypothetical protein A3B29_01660 [Candidatus Sungbacteria bacterium RIFCSPLOWO2_01_FULL_51_34]OHA11365.1 MAG: hypothetical protein A3I44_04885 [Candidatus Sungbacteria bacterium RIFCSPLOWO2_02_FULL_51_17]